MKNAILKYFQRWMHDRKVDKEYWLWFRAYRKQLRATGHAELYDINLAIFLYVSACTPEQAVLRTLERNTERRSIRRALGDMK